MTKSILEAFGTVRPDGTLELDRNVTPSPGRVKVRMEYALPPAPATETLVEYADRTRGELGAAGHKFMDDEEVATWIDEQRGDDRVEDLMARQTGGFRHSSFNKES